LILFEKELTLK